MLLVLTSMVLEAYATLVVVRQTASAVPVTPTVRAATNSTSSASSTSTSKTSAHPLDSATSTSTSDTPFFPYPSSLVPPAQNDHLRNSDITRLVVVACLFGCVLFTAIVWWRCQRIRWRNRSASRLFSTSSTRSPSPTNSMRSTIASRVTRFPSLPVSGPTRLGPTIVVLDNPFLYPSPYPSYLLHPSRSNAPQVRAMDTDEGGRRLGDANSSNDHDGELGDKDVLPAYDRSGGPPRYDES